MTTFSEASPSSQDAQLLRAVAVARARQLLSDPSVVLLDTETTDLDGYLVEVAVTRVTGEVLMDTLIDPCAPISAEASAVHGLTDRDLQDAPLFRDIADQLAGVLAGSTIVAYNAPYDQGVLKRDLARIGRPAERWRWVCAMQLHTDWTGDWDLERGRWRTPSLPTGTHRALGDCTALAELLRTIAGAHEPILENSSDGE